MRIFLKLALRIRPVFPAMLRALLFAWFSALSAIALMSSAAYLITAAALHPMIHELSIAITGVRFFGISRAIFRYAERYTAHDATFCIVTKLRVWCYEQMEALPLAKLDPWRSGERCALLTRQIDVLKDFYLRVLAPPLTALLVLFSLGAVLCWYQLASAFVLALSFGAIGLLLPAATYRLNRKNAVAAAEGQRQFSNQCIDLIGGIAELTAWNALPGLLDEIESAQRAQQVFQAKRFRLEALTAASAELMAHLTLLLILALMIPLVESRQISGIHLAVFALAVQSACETALTLPAVWRYGEDSLRAARQLDWLTASQPPADSQMKKPLPHRTLPLTIDRLCFAYERNRPILSELSFTLHPGERIAIVGASGAGKSTLLNLLLRLWDCDCGTIRMNGTDYRCLPADSIRQTFSVITQHTHLFHASIKENLRLLCPEATDEAIRTALRQAELDAFVTALPKGLDTDIGQGGRRLSGGQRQRLAIARAFLRPAPILLLDEPTASLDRVQAAKIMRTIAQSLQGRAMLLITHQLIGLESLDRILVLHEGKIAEQGTFAALLAQQGKFYRLWNLQRNF